MRLKNSCLPLFFLLFFQFFCCINIIISIFHVQRLLHGYGYSVIRLIWAVVYRGAFFVPLSLFFFPPPDCHQTLLSKTEYFRRCKSIFLLSSNNREIFYFLQSIINHGKFHAISSQFKTTKYVTRDFQEQNAFWWYGLMHQVVLYFRTCSKSKQIFSTSQTFW